MNINIYDYLQDIEKMNLPNDNGVILEDNNRIKKLDSLYDTYNDNYYYSVDNALYLYVKKLIDGDGNTSPRLLSELLASKVYEENGVNCIKTVPFRQLEEDGLSSVTCSASEDLTKVKGLVINDDNSCIDHNLDVFYRKNKRDISTKEICDEWFFIKNPLIKEYLLSVMTEESYEQLIDLLIIDTLFYNWDRFSRGKNLFFAKTPTSDKIEGIVPIDLETINFDSLKYNYNNSFREFFKDLYTDKIGFTMPQGWGTSMSYSDRILNLKKTMEEGYFNKRQTNLIKSILNCNITNEIEEILNKYNLDFDKRVIKIYKELWYRNGEMLKI